MIRVVHGQEVLGMAEHAVRREGVLAALGLGSCVAVILHDADAPRGGMAHVVLPNRALARDRTRLGRFAETAVPLLVEEMVTAGADPRRITARLVGGASMFGALIPAGTMHMGKRNVSACRAALHAAGLRSVAEAVGGERGRSVWFDVATGVVTVRSVGNDPITL